MQLVANSRRALLVVALLGMASPLHAQPATSASPEADALFDQGRQLMDAGKFAEACAAFDASQKVSPATSTLFNLAHCREQNGQLATAYGLFREADRQTRVPIDEGTTKLNQLAVERAKQLEPRLSKLTIVVAANHQVEGLEVRRGELLIEAGAWNRELPVDGGRHTITVRAPRYRPWKGTVDVGTEKDAKSIEIPMLELAPEPTPPLSSSRKALPFVVGGVGVLLIGGGVTFEVLARGTYADSEKEPNDARQTELWESANTKRYVAQGLAVAGIGCVGVGVWLYLRNARAEKEANVTSVAGFELAPVLARDHAGVQLVRGF